MTWWMIVLIVLGSLYGLVSFITLAIEYERDDETEISASVIWILLLPIAMAVGVLLLILLHIESILIAILTPPHIVYKKIQTKKQQEEKLDILKILNERRISNDI